MHCPRHSHECRGLCVAPQLGAKCNGVNAERNRRSTAQPQTCTATARRLHFDCTSTARQLNGHIAKSQRMRNRKTAASSAAVVQRSDHRIFEEQLARWLFQKALRSCVSHAVHRVRNELTAVLRLRVKPLRSKACRSFVPRAVHRVRNELTAVLRLRVKPLLSTHSEHSYRERQRI